MSFDTNALMEKDDLTQAELAWLVSTNQYEKWQGFQPESSPEDAKKVVASRSRTQAADAVQVVAPDGETPSGASESPEAARERYEALTVRELQERIDERNADLTAEEQIPRTGTKPELVQRLLDDDAALADDGDAS